MQHLLRIKTLDRNGYHKAYSEMFNLIEQRKLEITAAGPGTLLSLAPVVHENKEYLDAFKEKLTAAEEAERKSEQIKVYSNISELALYFSERNLTWLSHHFFDKALAIASESEFLHREIKEESPQKFSLS